MFSHDKPWIFVEAQCLKHHFCHRIFITGYPYFSGIYTRATLQLRVWDTSSVPLGQGDQAQYPEREKLLDWRGSLRVSIRATEPDGLKVDLGLVLDEHKNIGPTLTGDGVFTRLGMFCEIYSADEARNNGSTRVGRSYYTSLTLENNVRYLPRELHEASFEWT